MYRTSYRDHRTPGLIECFRAANALLRCIFDNTAGQQAMGDAPAFDAALAPPRG